MLGFTGCASLEDLVAERIEIVWDESTLRRFERAREVRMGVQRRRQAGDICWPQVMPSPWL